MKKELELFTVSIKEDSTIHVEFNEDLLALVTEDELKAGLEDKMNGLTTTVLDVVKFLRKKM